MHAEAFKAVKFSERVFWVGAIDWAIRDFHGYSTHRGTTYNAYLILGVKNILIDTVKAPFRAEMLSRIASVIEPARIDYIISNHAEMDHSGCLPEVLGLVKPEKVFASAMGVKALESHFHMGGEIQPVGDGERLRLGDVELLFMETRMLHWPDSMITYVPAERILFSQDAFGMHLASHERFDDELAPELLKGEAAKYYANILLPFSSIVAGLPGRMEKLGIAPRIIAPDHGPVWRKEPRAILELYMRWAAQRPERKAVIAYDTMWGSTELMARAIGEGLGENGARVALMPLRASTRSDVATEILDAGALLVGSPTINNGVFPTVADAMSYLKGLKRRNLMGASFGSHGWSGEAVKIVSDELRGMKVELLHDGLSVNYVPDNDALTRCVSLGRDIAEKLKVICGR